MTFRDKVGVSPTFSPWTSRPGFEGRGLSRSARVLDLVNCIAIQKLVTSNTTAENLESELKHTMLDYSQSHARRSATHADKHRCLTTSTTLYSYGLDRVVLPLETLWWQGFPRSLKVPQQVSSSDIKEFAGEGMTLPCLATILLSLIWNVDYGQGK